MVMIINSFDKFPNEPTGLMYEQFGKIGINPAVTSALSASDYTSSNFTTVGSTVAITSNSVVFSSTPTNADDGQYMQIDSLAETDTWSLNFKLNFSVHNTFDNVYLGFTNASSTWNTSNTYIRLQTQGGGYQRFTLGTRISGSNTESTSATNTALVNTDYWCTFSSDGSGTATFKAWTNSGRTGTAHVTLTKTYTGVGTMNYIQHRTYASGDTNVWTGTVSEITATTKPTLTSPASTKVKQHFIEWFSGKQLPSYWDKSNTNGTQAMADSVDGGLLMSTTSSGSSISYIDFADKKQFSNTGSVMIAVMKHGSVTGGESYTGLQSGTTQGNGQGAWSYVNDAWKGAVFNFYTVGASGGTWVQTGCVTSDTNWHIHKIELTSSAGSLQIDGNTTVTSTTNLPAVSLQPSVGINNTSAVNRTLNIRYMECFNT